MISNGHDVAVFEHHVSSTDPFTNAYTNARGSYYGMQYIPDAYFDGILNILGGSNYNSYLAKVDQRLAIPSNFSLSINGFNDGLDYTVVLAIENVEPYTGTNIVLQFGVTESNLSSGGTEYDFVTRQMFPNASGTPLDFSGGSNQTVLLEFSMNASWVTENCEFVAFVQDNTSKEILQGEKVAVPDLLPLFYNNAGSQAINMVPVLNCAGEVAPRVTISNEGADALTSVDINYKVNDEGLNTFSWTGNLAYGETEQVDLPVMAFDILDDNDLLVYTTNPNGGEDEDNSNDTVTTGFGAASEVVPDIYLNLKLDDNPGETTWELKNSSGEVLYSGGPYSEPQQYVTETFELNEDDCYTFYLYDEAGDGLAEPGFYKLKQNDFSLIYENEGFANSEELVQFSINQTSVSQLLMEEGLSIFPNPFKDFTNVTFTLNEVVNVELTVYNLIGEVVYTSSRQNMGSGNHKLMIDTQNFTPGIYFVSLVAGDKVYTKKISSY